MAKAGRPKGQKIEQLDVDKAVEFPRKLWDKSARIVAAELENYIRDHSARPNPTGKQPSNPGEYPKAVTTRFLRGVRVIYSKGTNSFRVYSRAPHGKFLQDGTKTMEARPWATKALSAKDWVQRVAAIARQFNK